MAIDINSLFADIIDTPEQRKAKLLQQGMAQGQLLSSGLTGLTRAAAPLAQVAGQLGVQRQENLRRAVQPMLGLDPRTAGEKLAEKIGSLDLSNPADMLKAAQELQSIDPVRAASLRQAAVNKQAELSDRARTIRRQDEADVRARAQEQRAANAEQRAVTSWGLGVVDAAVQREREAEAIANEKQLKTSVADIARENGMSDLAELIGISGLNSNQLISLQQEIVADPDIESKSITISGRELINRGYDVPNKNATYTAFVRTNEGKDPTNKPSDRIGAIIADSAFYETKPERIRQMPEDEEQRLQELVSNDPRFELLGIGTDDAVNRIYEAQEQYILDRGQAVESALENAKTNTFESPLSFKVDNRFREQPQAFIPNITREFLQQNNIRKDDRLEIQFITADAIKKHKLKGVKEGSVVVTFPIRENGRYVFDENNNPKTDTFLIPR